MHCLLRRFGTMRLGIAPIGVQRPLRRGDRVNDGIIATVVFLARGDSTGKEPSLRPAVRQPVRQRIQTAAMTEHQARR